MSKQKFTPGPWALNRHGAIVGGEFYRYTNGSAQSQLAMACGGNGIDEETRNANARLIAAAPELLEAAIKQRAEFESLLRDLKFKTTGRDPKNDGYAYAELADWKIRQFIASMDAAIAKATGEQS